jgi:hypothetical protein
MTPEVPPMPPGAVINFSLDFLSALVALLTSYYSYRVNRLVGNPVLAAISIGFMLLGIGLAVEAATSLISGVTLVEFVGERVLVLFASYTYLTVQMLAYLVIAVGYARAANSNRAKSLVLVASPGVVAINLFMYSLLSYFVALILLAFVVFQGFLLHSREKNRFSATVLTAFSLVLLAHLVLLASVITLGPVLFLVGTVVQFLGFLSLLVFVVRSEVIGAG